ncbi:recombinase family protein [Sinorhizobium meliloti]|uniref:recombinase family protein n=1 Tax=Rhizobium meliloti TaxID=382 RepID=UPI002D7A0737|nr:recombinase family protein [Sinorhizobium meliloti]WRQ66864.1 recombinase family protein [Sinorhizobium meliloti]
MKIAVYARCSSDLQREASIADQLRMCRLRPRRRQVDPSISGSSMIQRPGLQALVMDSARCHFDMVLAEALDRVSRDKSAPMPGAQRQKARRLPPGLPDCL